MLLVLFEDARRQAAELDNEFAKTNKLRGVLHGVPMSFKDQCTSSSSVLLARHCDQLCLFRHATICTVDITGYDTTIGFTTWSDKPSTENATVSFNLPLPPVPSDGS